MALSFSQLCLVILESSFLSHPWVVFNMFTEVRWLAICQYFVIFHIDSKSLKCTKICNYYIKAEWPKSNFIANLTFRRQINQLMRLKHFLLDFSLSLSRFILNDCPGQWYRFAFLGIFRAFFLACSTTWTITGFQWTNIELQS